MHSELPHPPDTSFTPEQIEEQFVTITHTGNENPMWHFSLRLPHDMNQLVSSRNEPPLRDGQSVSLACFALDDHSTEIEVLGAWIDREINPIDAMMEMIKTLGFAAASVQWKRSEVGIVGDAVVEWSNSGQRLAGCLLVTKRGPRTFFIWARTTRLGFPALAESLLCSLRSFSVVDLRPGPLAEIIRMVEGNTPIPWKAPIPNSWKVSTVASRARTSSFPATLGDVSGAIQAKLLFVILTPEAWEGPRALAAKYLASLFSTQLVKEGEWSEKGGISTFERSWNWTGNTMTEVGVMEVNCRVCVRPDAWVIAGIVGPRRDVNSRVWMSSVRLLDLVTIDLLLPESRSSSKSLVEIAPITTREEFNQQLVAALADAERLATEHLDQWQFVTLAQLFSTMDRITDGREPEESERQTFSQMLSTLRENSPNPSVELTGLLARYASLSDYFVRWPTATESPTSLEDLSEEVDETGAITPLQTLEQFVQCVHEANDEVKALHKNWRQRKRSGSAGARTMEAVGDIDRKLNRTLRAVGEWVRESRWIDAKQQQELLITPRAARLLQDSGATELAIQARSIDAFLRTWKPPNPAGVDTVDSLSDMVHALQQIKILVAELRDRFADHPLLSAIESRASRMQQVVEKWVRESLLPRVDEHEELELSPTIDQHLALYGMTELPSLIEHVRTIGISLNSWPPAFRESFLRDLFETDIEAKFLLLRTGDESLAELERCLQLAVYSAADDRINTEYGRSQIGLTEAYDRYLAIYNNAATTQLVRAARLVDGFFRTWLKGANPLDATGDHSTAASTSIVDIEASDLLAFTGTETEFDSANGFDAEGSEIARGWTHAYFLHMLASTIQSFSTKQQWSVPRRQVGMALRAMRRWTNEGHPAPESKRRAVAALFRTLACDPEQEVSDGNPRDFAEAQQVHAYFQIWPHSGEALIEGKCNDGRCHGVIRSPEAFAGIVNDTLADADCLVAVDPTASNLTLARALRRVQQSVAFKRELVADERIEIDSVLSTFGPLATGFPFIPDFAEQFVADLRRLNDYFQGRRVSSVAAFIELLSLTHEDAVRIIGGRAWDTDNIPLAILERQFRYLKRWTANGRSPTLAECAGTREAMFLAPSLKGAEQEPEFILRCHELSEAVDTLFAPVSQSSGSTPAPLSIVGLAGLEQAVDEAIRDAHSLAAHSLFATATRFQAFWRKVLEKLNAILKLLDPTTPRTLREREEIRAALSGELQFDANPCPTVPDFREDLRLRLRAVNDAFQAIASAEPYRSKESRPVDASGIECVTFGQSVMMHFARAGGHDSGIYTCRFDRTHREAMCGELPISITTFLPTDRELIHLVRAESWSTSAIQISPGGDYIAYATHGNAADEIGWCSANQPGELGRVPGTAFAWTTHGRTLLVFDARTGIVWRIDTGKNDRRELVKMPSLAEGTPAPRLIVSPNGGRVVLSYRPQGQDRIDLHSIAYQGRATVTQLLASEAGRGIDVIPCWANGQGDLAYLAIDETRKSSWIAIPSPDGKGQSEKIFSIQSCLTAQPPSWSASGRYVAFLQPSADGESHLMLFDCDTQTATSLESIGPVSGRPVFGEETILMQGGQAGVSVWFRNLPQKRVELESF